MMNEQGRASPGSAAPAEEKSCPWLNIWLFLILALAIKAAFMTICLGLLLLCDLEDGLFVPGKELCHCFGPGEVTVLSLRHSSDQPRALQQQPFSEWKCDSAVPQGTDRGWTCCPKGWERFQRSCYFLSLDMMNWAESDQNCTGMGSQLVVINSRAEQDFLTEQIKKPPERENFYIGLFAEKVRQWQWVDKTPYNVTAAFWRKGEPNYLPGENCTVMHMVEKTPNNWNDVVSDLMHHRICEAAAVTV